MHRGRSFDIVNLIVLAMKIKIKSFLTHSHIHPLSTDILAQITRTAFLKHEPICSTCTSSTYIITNNFTPEMKKSGKISVEEETVCHGSKLHT